MVCTAIMIDFLHEVSALLNSILHRIVCSIIIDLLNDIGTLLSSVYTEWQA